MLLSYPSGVNILGGYVHEPIFTRPGSKLIAVAGIFNGVTSRGLLLLLTPCLPSSRRFHPCHDGSPTEASKGLLLRSKLSERLILQADDVSIAARARKLDRVVTSLSSAVLPFPHTLVVLSYSAMSTQDAAHGLPIETKPVVDTLASIVLGDKGVLDRLMSARNTDGGVMTSEGESRP